MSHYNTLFRNHHTETLRHLCIDPMTTPLLPPHSPTHPHSAVKTGSEWPLSLHLLTNPVFIPLTFDPLVTFVPGWITAMCTKNLKPVCDSQNPLRPQVSASDQLIWIMHFKFVSDGVLGSALNSQSTGLNQWYVLISGVVQNAGNHSQTWQPVSTLPALLLLIVYLLYCLAYYFHFLDTFLCQLFANKFGFLDIFLVIFWASPLQRIFWNLGYFLFQVFLTVI